MSTAVSCVASVAGGEIGVLFAAGGGASLVWVLGRVVAAQRSHSVVLRLSSCDQAAGPPALFVTLLDQTGLSVGPEPPVDGGVCVAVEPRAECNEYGDFLIYPDAFEGELPAGENGVEVVRERQFATIVAEREARAVTSMGWKASMIRPERAPWQPAQRPS